MSAEKNSGNNEDKALVTPEEAEKRVTTAVNDVVPDGLLIEEDGDPFWVIQQVFWGILKTATLLAILLFLIWLVWRPGSLFEGSGDEGGFAVDATPVEVVVPEPDSVSTDENDKPSFWKRLFGRGDETSPSEPVSTPPPDQGRVTPTVPDTPVQPTPTPANPSTTPTSNNSRSSTGAEVAYELEEGRILLVRGIIPESVKWLREAKTVGEISMSMVRQGPPAVRSRQVEEILAAADQLFVRAANLQAQLQSETDYFLRQGEAANARTAELEKSIATTLQNFDPVPVEALVNQKVQSQQQASYFMSNAKIRDTLRRNIQTFDQLLRQQSIPLLNPATEIRAS